MMNSEIDAGPPNKRPKIGNVILASNSTNNVLGNVNGLSTQISESTGLFYFNFLN